MKYLVAALVLASLSKLVGDTAAFIAVSAAGLAGIGFIVRKVIQPAAGTLLRTYRGVAVLEELPRFIGEMRTWRADVDARLEHGHGHMARIDDVLEQLAAERVAD